MLCYVMLCYVMLCYVMLCYVMLCYVMLCYAMLCYVIQFLMLTINYAISTLRSVICTQFVIIHFFIQVLQFCILQFENYIFHLRQLITE